MMNAWVKYWNVPIMPITRVKNRIGLIIAGDVPGPPPGGGSSISAAS